MASNATNPDLKAAVLAALGAPPQTSDPQEWMDRLMESALSGLEDVSMISAAADGFQGLDLNNRKGGKGGLGFDVGMLLKQMENTESALGLIESRTEEILAKLDAMLSEAGGDLEELDEEEEDGGVPVAVVDAAEADAMGRPTALSPDATEPSPESVETETTLLEADRQTTTETTLLNQAASSAEPIKNDSDFAQQKQEQEEEQPQAKEQKVVVGNQQEDVEEEDVDMELDG
ncbi:hypothetical protein HDV05_002806 [Chytridiales sp. JEL 0842]|nr:hypothetical protein HDV05_002806 [Chytridiales sp. JEL 0842]